MDDNISKLIPYFKSKYNMVAFKKIMSKFMSDRQVSLYDTCPCDRIIYGLTDIQEFFIKMDVDIQKVQDAITKTYYYKISNFNPAAAKDPLTISVLCFLKCAIDLKKKDDIVLWYTYLSFSGKFYPSVHYGSFPTCPPSEYRHVMEYVINNKLSNKYDIKSKGSVIKSIQSVANTWVETYTTKPNDLFKTFDDEDVVYLIQQLHDRIKSFMKNIASEYYDAYNNGEYMSYDSDSIDDDDYHMADNNQFKYDRVVQKALTNITTRDVDYTICRMCSDSNITTDEIKSILESIITQNTNLKLIEELLSLLVVQYCTDYPNGEVTDIKFINYSMTPKPNSKEKNVLRIKEIVEIFLDENSPAYRKRKSRPATKNSYNRAVLRYFATIIHNSNR